MVSTSNLRIILDTFKMYRWHVAALVAFGFLSAILEGITHSIQILFGFLHLPFSFRYLLGFILALFMLRAVFVVVFGYIRGWIGADFLGKESGRMAQVGGL